MHKHLILLSGILLGAAVSTPVYAQSANTPQNTKNTTSDTAALLPPSSSPSVLVVAPSASSPTSTQVVSVSPDTKPTGVEADPAAPQPSAWGQILSQYTVQASNGGPTLFDYKALAASPSDMEKLAHYIQNLSAQKPSTMDRAHAMAYWANLYNALTVQVVAQNYPVKSIREIKSGWRKGPWRRELVTVEGEKLSLDSIEHGIMRPTFKTPLVHYMVNCASIGCPNLKPTPWRAETLDADLENAARTYINSPRGVNIVKGRLTVSSIYRWFRKDFGNNEADIIAHLLAYADNPLKARIVGFKKIDKYKYNWDVNAP